MEEPIKNIHHPLKKELLTIKENPIEKKNFLRHTFKRLYTFTNSKNSNSLFSIKKVNKITPKLERTLTHKKENLSQTPHKAKKRKTDYNISLNNDLVINHFDRNKKIFQLKNNMCPTSPNNDNMLNSNYNSSNDKSENTNFEQFNKKIYEFYNMYKKTYDNNSIDNMNRNKTIDKKYLNTIKTDTENNEKDKKMKNKIMFSDNINNIVKRNKYLTNFKSKTIAKFRINNSLNLNKEHNVINKNHFKTNKHLNQITSSCLTENNKKGVSILEKSSSFLRSKVTDLLKELNLKKNSEYYLIKRDEMNEKRKKATKNKQKERGKLVSLLNRPGEIQKDFGKINDFSKKKIQKGENNFLIRKPTNNIEMNNLLINSFGAGYNHNEFSKKMFNLNETFFALLEVMKQKRAEMDIAKFEREKNKYIKKGFQKQNYESYYLKNNRDKWEKKFMHDQYIYKIPETEFKKFKKYKQNELKKQIIKDSQKLSELLTNMDAEEYEFPDSIFKYFKSSKNSISLKNVKRIHRVNKILKNIEDEEQVGKLILKADKLKKEQRNIENEIINIIGRSGKPRFVKTVFKPTTIRKYKGISGNYFGLPA